MCILPSIPLLCTSKTTSRPHPANRCASLTHDGDRINTWSGPSADKNRVDQWTPKGAEAGHEEDQKGETEGNGERSECDTPLLLRFTKKRPLSSAKKKPCVKRRVKRRRFWSSFSSDEATRHQQLYIFQTPHPSRPRSISSVSTSFEGATYDNGMMGPVDE